MMCALVMVPGWSKSFPWIPTCADIHLLEDDFWFYTLDIQRCDDTLSCSTFSLGVTSLIGRWCRPCQVSCSLCCLCFVAHKTPGLSQFRISILIWSALSAFLLSILGPWYSFPLLCFRSGRWLHRRIVLPLCVYWFSSCVVCSLSVVRMIMSSYHSLFLNVCFKRLLRLWFLLWC